MIQFVEKKAKTVDQAIEEALAELGATADEAVIEVLHEGETGGLLGFGRRPAHVKVSVEREDSQLGLGNLDEPIAESELPAAVEESRREDSAPSEKSSGERSKRRNQQAKRAPKAEPRQESQAERKERPGEEAKKRLSAEEKEAIENQAVEFLTGILSDLEIHGTMASYYDNEDTLHLEVEGNELGHAIGRGGETLEAIQYMTTLAINKNREDYLRVIIDIGKYREKNSRILRQRTERAAERVLATGRYYQMPPMPASERRFVHLVVAGIEGVESSSQGAEPRRRVVIRKV
ncbi:MAG: RNA-binding cell elongation regulator Jag/EloR [Eubacteriales bacterium]|nr:RNA-binding cell elongation regulator Jag/EloR [Eubacteriales bacterium]